MSQLKIASYNAVALLDRLRQGTGNSSKTFRRAIFNGLRNVVKDLGLVGAKTQVEAISEGLDANGEHWFIVEITESEVEKPIPQKVYNIIDQLWFAVADAEESVDEVKLVFTPEQWHRLLSKFYNLGGRFKQDLTNTGWSPTSTGWMTRGSQNAGTPTEQVQGRAHRTDGSEVVSETSSQGPPAETPSPSTQATSAAKGTTLT